MGFLETLFGPDGPGGQPGAVGNAMNAAGGAYKKASETPFASLLTLPTEIIRDPLQFTNSEGKLDIAALLSPNARKTFAAQKQAADDAAKVKAIGEAYNLTKTATELFANAPTPEARAKLAEGMIGFGLSESEFNPFRQSADIGQEAARAVGREVGMMPATTALLDPNAAQQAGQTRFASDRQLQEIGAQGAETRRNQGNQFGLSSKLAGIQHGYRMDEAAYSDQLKAAQQQYGAELNVWEDQQKQGKNPDPYPVLQGLYDGGAFKGNPQAEQIVGYHVTNRTDPAAATKLLTDFQTATMRPAEQGTMTERRDKKVLKNLKLMKREFPAEQRQDVRATLRSGDAQQARTLLSQRAAMKKAGDDYVKAANVYMQTPSFGGLSPEQQAIVKSSADAGDQSTLKIVMPALLKNDTMGAAKAFSNPLVRSLAEQAGNLRNAKSTATAALDAARDPANPDFLDPSLFGAVRSRIPVDVQLMDPSQPADWKARKQALYTAATDSLSAFILSRSGKAASDKERAMYIGSWLNGNEPSPDVFIAKYNAIQRAMDRELELREQEARMVAGGIGSGSIDKGMDVMFGDGMAKMYAENARKLAAELSSADADPNLQPDGPLTPEEQAALAKYRGN